MRKQIYILVLSVVLLFSASEFLAQDDRKVNFTGSARSLFYADDLVQDTTAADTVTVPKLNSGHVLVDLGVNIRPNKQTEILGMVRIRNDYGGFWGAGVTFDVRQLYVKGVIGGIVRYQLGDINYKMTKYTMWNYDQELISNTSSIFQQQTNVMNYDHFYYSDYSRRQQGAAAEFALVFSKVIKEIQFHAVTTRVKASDFAGTPDRLFSGLNANLIQSKFLEVGINYANMYDIPGTSKNKNNFVNPVTTATVKAMYEMDSWKAIFDSEFGKSRTWYKNDSLAPDWRGKFYSGTLAVGNKDWGLQVSLNNMYISSEFRSPGAQTKRIEYNGLPKAYSRITNEQNARSFTMLDLMRESSFYNLQLRPYLMAFAPKYDNITPYGDATPNRQGYTLAAKYEKKDIPVVATISHMEMQEVRGEGTKLPRKFSRNNVNATIRVNEFFPGWKKRFHIMVNYRDDQTTRQGEDLVRSVDLSTTAMSAGLEIEVLKSLDILLGMQNITYKGFDYVAVRNGYSEIFNFNEYKVDGSEKMNAFGLRYRFSENAFISAQMNKFMDVDVYSLLPSYSVNQFMLLFQMKF